MNGAMLLFSVVLGFHGSIGIAAYRQSRERVFLVLALMALPVWVWAYMLFGGQ